MVWKLPGYQALDKIVYNLERNVTDELSEKEELFCSVTSLDMLDFRLLPYLAISIMHTLYIASMSAHLDVM